MKICPSCKLIADLNKAGYCGDCHNKRCRNWYAKNSDRHKEISLASYYKNKYGMTKKDIQILAELQNKQCAICKINIHFNGTLSATQGVIDHCHKTSKIRGILCTLCNIGLGSFKEDRTALNNAALYLQENDH